MEEKEFELLESTELDSYYKTLDYLRQIDEKKLLIKKLQDEVRQLEYSITSLSKPIARAGYKTIEEDYQSRKKELKTALDSFNKDIRIEYLSGSISKDQFLKKLRRRKKKYFLLEKEIESKEFLLDSLFSQWKEGNLSESEWKSSKPSLTIGDKVKELDTLYQSP